MAAGLAAEGARWPSSVAAPTAAARRPTSVGAAAALVADLTVAGEAARLVADAVAALGGLDICVVNTGGGTPGPILATDGADDAAYQAMLRPVLEISRAAAPHLVAGGDGSDDLPRLLDRSSRRRRISP